MASDRHRRQRKGLTLTRPIPPEELLPGEVLDEDDLVTFTTPDELLLEERALLHYRDGGGCQAACCLWVRVAA